MSTATALFIYLGAIIVFMLILLFGWGVMITAAAVIAAFEGKNIKQEIQPLLNEW